VVALVDTNVLVYRFDSREPRKKAIATELLREGAAEGTLRIPHQALVELVAATTRARGAAPPILSPEDARHEAELLLSQFTVLYPNAAIFRTALRGAATYQLAWFDAHLWAYAEYFGIQELWSEDFEHGRMYGTVRIVDPFR
jgi:predicted nucleic acid-binding protein